MNSNADDQRRLCGAAEGFRFGSEFVSFADLDHPNDAVFFLNQVLSLVLFHAGPVFQFASQHIEFRNLRVYLASKNFVSSAECTEWCVCASDHHSPLTLLPELYRESLYMKLPVFDCLSHVMLYEEKQH